MNASRCDRCLGLIDAKGFCACGDWIVTFTGRRWFVRSPHPADVCIEDIAHALAHLCRFGGHCCRFYSVAEHSLRVMRALEASESDPRLLLFALLHDASEAYLGDVVRPLKYSLPDYRSIERATEAVIFAALLDGQTPTSAEWETVKHFDDVLLMTEKRDLLAAESHKWSIEAEPLASRISPSIGDDPRLIAADFRFQFSRLVAEFRKGVRK